MSFYGGFKLAKIELGIKRTCQACGVVFYDLNKYPIVCPKCDVEFDPEAVLKSRRARLPVPEEPEAKLKNDASEVGGEDDISDVDIEDENPSSKSTNYDGKDLSNKSLDGKNLSNCDL